MTESLQAALKPRYVVALLSAVMLSIVVAAYVAPDMDLIIFVVMSLGAWGLLVGLVWASALVWLAYESELVRLAMAVCITSLVIGTALAHVAARA